jgi:DNA-binding MarR family transcriptional regulator
MPSLTSHQRVLRQVRALVNDLSASARTIEHRTGITNAQLFVLQSLATHGPQSIGELAARARTQLSTASIVVSRLERAGLVAKSRATEDRRRAVITVTASGRQIARRGPQAPTSRLLAATESLSPAAARALSKSLAPLLAALNVSADGDPMLFERPSRGASAR